jgi:hypothetical protein
MAAGLAMTTRAVTMIGYVVVGCAGVLFLMAGRLGVMARPGEVVDALLARRWSRMVIVLVWAWLGWHFLVRTG